MSQMAGVRELDQFFTRADVAAQCFGALSETLAKLTPANPQWFFVEPSAGDGAFYDLLPPQRRLGLDIAPRRPEFARADFLTARGITNTPSAQTVVVGNPPFGTRGRLAVDFCRRAAEIADTVAFIVPVIFRKYFIHKQMPEGWRLALTQEIGRQAFYTPDGKPFGVNAEFQVWTKYPGEENKRVFTPPPIAHPDFKMRQYNNTKAALKHFDAPFDFAVPCQGWQDYSRRETRADKCEKNKQWILFDAPDKKIRARLREELNFKELALKHTTSVPGFRKGDVVAEYSRVCAH